MNIILSYDTSCYTTSMAAVSNKGKLIISARKMLEVKKGNRGLRQSEAVFKHLQQINLVQGEVFSKIHNTEHSVVAVAASTKPRDQENSYMPVFLVGTRFAQQLSDALSVPFIEGNHQIGHIFAAKYGTGLRKDEFLGFHLSGGTTDLLKINGFSVEIIAKSLDTTIGKVIDRVGVALGLPFPSGKYLEELALQSTDEGLPEFSTTVINGNCNLSGLESKAMKSIGSYSPINIAKSLFKSLAVCCAKMIVYACKNSNIYDILVFGGVASSDLFRQLLIENVIKRCNHIKIHFGKTELSGDNAAGIGLYALEVLNNGQNN